MVCIGISSCGSILVTAKIFRIRAYWLPYAMLVGSNFIGQWREVIDETEFLIYNGTLR